MRNLFTGNSDYTRKTAEAKKIKFALGIGTDYPGAFIGSLVGAIFSFSICTAVTYLSDQYYDVILLIIPIIIGEAVRLGARSGDKNIRYIPLVFSFLTLNVADFASIAIATTDVKYPSISILNNALSFHKFIQYRFAATLSSIFEIFYFFGLSLIAFYICRIAELKEFE